MNSSLSRREFLKLAGLLPLSYSLPPTLSSKGEPADNAGKENVLFILFDAWTADNTSLYGYERKTTPHINRLAEKAIVYHNHYASSHFTSPGTASLLTGTTPWTHHAFEHSDLVVEHLARKNIFNAFSNYYRLAYTHNPLANVLLLQFLADIDDYTPWERLYFENDAVFSRLFQNDFDNATIGRDRALKQQGDGYSFALYLSRLYQAYKTRSINKIRESFPRGVPDHIGVDFFILEDAIDWTANMLAESQQPFLGYYHYLPPHDPYNTRIDFHNTFEGDGYQPIDKPEHFFKRLYSQDRFNRIRQAYDEFLLYIDSEFNRFYQRLQQAGILENTWLILTSDHGEMFERGVLGHSEPVYYEPILRIPLLIFPPEQKKRVDVYERTSAIDLLPTLLSITGQDAADWVEGDVMPPFSKTFSGQNRDFSSIQVDKVDKTGSIELATATLIQGDYKLIWYYGYEQIKPESEMIELYDLGQDPEELNDLSVQRKNIADELIDILMPQVQELDQSYLG